MKQLVESIINGLLKVIFTYLYNPWSVATPFFSWAFKGPPLVLVLDLLMVYDLCLILLPLLRLI